MTPRVTRVLIAIGLVAGVLVGASRVDAAPLAPNLGVPGSACVGHDGGFKQGAADPEFSTTALGDDAPAYYEVGGAVGPSTERVMVMVHGGGWHTVGPGLVTRLRGKAREWRFRDWTTVNIDYRACGESLGDVVWFLHRTRQLNRNATICIVGWSAGGHLALLAAGWMPDISCVISEAGATDLVNMAKQMSYDEGTQTFDRVYTTMLSNYAAAAFGTTTQKLAAYSPIVRAGVTPARVLLAAATRDPFLPAVQYRRYARLALERRPGAYVRTLALDPGLVPFTHAGISIAGKAKYDAAVDELVAPFEAA